LSIYRFSFAVVILIFLSSCSVSKNSKIITSKKEAIEDGSYEVLTAKEKALVIKANKAILKEKQLLVKIEKTKNNKLKNANKFKSDFKRDSVAAAIQETYLSEKEEDVYIKSTLVDSANEYIGTPYRYGGSTKKGIDCSAFMKNVYDSVDLELPRTSFAQSLLGQKIKRTKAKTGDLIFFKTNRKRTISHVGMVLNNFDGEIFFIHASTSKGVMVSSLKEKYYQSNYAKIKRVLN
jgi:cell wall-associated NlpC family hydrolase